MAQDHAQDHAQDQARDRARDYGQDQGRVHNRAHDHAQGFSQDRQAGDFARRFFGGPPLAVIGRLILLSILVGVILAAVGLDPWNIIASVRQLVVRIWTMGFEVVRWLWRYFLLGAVIVLPIWILVRLAKTPRRR